MIDGWVSDLLTRIQRITPAYVAGGYLRDKILGVQPKDVDIFLFHAPFRRYEEVAKEVKRTHPSREEAVCGPEYFAWNTEVQSSQQFVSDDGWPEVNLICIDSPDAQKLIDRFDFAICRAVFNGENVVTSPEFWQDRTDKTFTLAYCPNHPSYIRSMERWKRISVRYPGWRLNAEKFTKAVLAPYIDLDDIELF